MPTYSHQPSTGFTGVVSFPKSLSVSKATEKLVKDRYVTACNCLDPGTRRPIGNDVGCEPGEDVGGERPRSPETETETRGNSISNTSRSADDEMFELRGTDQEEPKGYTEAQRPLLRQGLRKRGTETPGFRDVEIRPGLEEAESQSSSPIPGLSVMRQDSRGEQGATPHSSFEAIQVRWDEPNGESDGSVRLVSSQDRSTNQFGVGVDPDRSHPRTVLPDDYVVGERPVAWVCSWCGFPDSEWLDSLTGLGSSLKPAHEPIVVARKPLIGTLVANVLEHGTGALNIDATRIGTPEDLRRPFGTPSEHVNQLANLPHGELNTGSTLGRWPSNVLLSHAQGCERIGTKKVSTGTAVQRNREEGDKPASVYGTYQTQQDDATYAGPDGKEEMPIYRCVEGCPVAELDRQSGVLTSGSAAAGGHVRKAISDEGIYGSGKGLWQEAGSAGELYGDTGGASRFYKTFEADPGFRYIAKASSSERNAGLYDLPERPGGVLEGNANSHLSPHKIGAEPDKPVAPTKNFHSTVKPVELMRWLIRLVTPPGGTILDPFLGSGTTLIAAIGEGVKGIGIEKEADYAELACERVKNATVQLSLF